MVKVTITNCVAALALSATNVLAAPQPQPTAAPVLVKRQQQVVQQQSVWWSTLANGNSEAVTPTVIDGVTISASPASGSEPTPWVSLDGSGIPYAVTPTVSGGETISASPTPTDSDYPTPEAVPPVLRCFGDRVPSEDSSTPGYPFCTPLNGTEWVPGQTYWITWDPMYWGGNITRVKLQGRSLPIKENADLIFETEWISNADGYYPLYVKESYRVSDNLGYFFLNMAPLVTQDTTATHVGTVSGPIVRFLKTDYKSEAITSISRLPSDNAKATTGSKSSGSSGISKGGLAAAIVVPIVVVLFAGVGVYFWFYKKRSAKGYGEGHKDKRIKSVNPAAGTGADDVTSTYTAGTEFTTVTPSATNTNATMSSNPFK